MNIFKSSLTDSGNIPEVKSVSHNFNLTNIFVMIYRYALFYLFFQIGTQYMYNICFLYRIVCLSGEVFFWKLPVHQAGWAGLCSVPGYSVYIFNFTLIHTGLCSKCTI